MKNFKETNKDFKKANKEQVKNFKKNYCKSEKKRLNLVKNKDFKITPLIFSDALPNHPVYSYASGNRLITKSYVLFLVEDTKNNVNYFPIFSENIGRKILNNLGEDCPRKISFYNILNRNNNSKNKTISKINKNTLKPEVFEFEKLILLSCFFMNKDTEDFIIPYGAFRNLLLKINKDYVLKAQDIKSVNTGLKNFISKKELSSDRFKEFIKFLVEDDNADIKKVNFEDLRKIFKEKYSNEKIFF